MKQSITDALEAQQVDVVDINGDGRHVGIDVIAHAFEVSLLVHTSMGHPMLNTQSVC